MESDALNKLFMKMKFKQVVCGSAHQTCSNAAHRFQLFHIGQVAGQVLSQVWRGNSASLIHERFHGH